MSILFLNRKKIFEELRCVMTAINFIVLLLLFSPAYVTAQQGKNEQECAEKIKINSNIKDAVRLVLNQHDYEQNGDTLAFPFNDDNEKKKFSEWLEKEKMRLKNSGMKNDEMNKFLRIVFYESNRAGIEVDMALALIEVLSEFDTFKNTISGRRGYLSVPGNVLNVLKINRDPNVLYVTRINLRIGFALLRSFMDENQGDLYKAIQKYCGNEIPRVADKFFAAWKRNRDDLVVSRNTKYPQKSGEVHSDINNQYQVSENNSKGRPLNLVIQNSKPDSDGSFTIDIQTNADTSSLKINGNEQGGRQGGKYSIKLVARAGQKTDINIIVTDIFGNTDTKTITVNREVVESKVAFAALNPAQVKRQAERDAVAIIIGIAEYKSLPRADYANDDARVFYDYAIRALGVRPENIKLLVDADADEVAILKAFRNWLPSKVRSTTDVYVYYSGHGYPDEDGNGLYLLPSRADREFIPRTSIQLQEINADLLAAKPKSVTIFMDACYSGQARNGETLVASARPIMPKVHKKLFPDNFSVITASQADQWSSSSPELKHGIFSYYLMKGMEGDADANKDGRITLGEMRAYLVENVGRQAGAMSRKQEPQLIGEPGRVLVGK